MMNYNRFRSDISGFFLIVMYIIFGNTFFMLIKIVFSQIIRKIVLWFLKILILKPVLLLLIRSEKELVVNYSIVLLS